MPKNNRTTIKEEEITVEDIKKAKRLLEKEEIKFKGKRIMEELQSREDNIWEAISEIIGRDNRQDRQINELEIKLRSLESVDNRTTMNWEEKFDKKFPRIFNLVFPNDINPTPNDSTDDIKQFITSLLSQQKEEYKKNLIDNIHNFVHHKDDFYKLRYGDMLDTEDIISLIINS